MSVDTVIAIGFGLYLYTGLVLLTFMVALELALKPQTSVKVKDVSLWGAVLLCVFLWPLSVYNFPEAIREWKESR